MSKVACRRALYRDGDPNGRLLAEHHDHAAREPPDGALAHRLDGEWRQAQQVRECEAVIALQAFQPHDVRAVAAREPAAGREPGGQRVWHREPGWQRHAQIGQIGVKSQKLSYCAI